MGTFRKLFFITSSRRLGVWLLSLLSYGRTRNENTLTLMGNQGEKLPMKIAPVFKHKLMACV
jgi:hypothetical protein